MKPHVQKLRLYWQGAGDWDEAHVNHLGALLQVAPYENVLPVRERGHQCCKKLAFTSVALDDRAESTCPDCGSKWLVLHKSVEACVREAWGGMQTTGVK